MTEQAVSWASVLMGQHPHLLFWWLIGGAAFAYLLYFLLEGASLTAAERQALYYDERDPEGR